MENSSKWLTELEGTVPPAAYGRDINIYTIAYEAWRRGLYISFENIYSKSRGRNFPVYHIYNNERSVKFTYNRSGSVSKKILNKLSVRERLAKENISLPESKVINTVMPEEVKKNTVNFNYPLMMTVLNTGTVITVSNQDELLQSVEYQSENFKTDRFLLEESIEGERCHAYIVDDSVIGIYKKLSPSITGDGVKSIKELLKEYNILRREIPSITDPVVSLTEAVKGQLEKQNYSADAIPGKGEVIKLKEGIAGGDATDITDELSDNMKSELVNIIKAFPRLVQGEVEFIYNQQTGEYAVLAVNSKPDIKNYLYPMHGQARNIPRAIIDYHFPETEGEYLSDTTPKFYFDYEIVHEQLRNNSLSKIILPKHRYEPNLISKSIKFESRYDLKKLRKIIRQNFTRLKFDGEFNVLDNNQFELFIAGNYQDMAYFIDYLDTKKYLKNITSNNYNHGVKIGYTFNDLRSGKSPKADNTAQTIQEKDKRISELEQEIKNLKKSKSWTITAPVRKIRRNFGK